MKKIVSHKGLVFTIIEAEKKYASKLIDYMNKICGETEFLSFGVGEFKMTIEEEADFVEKTKEDENSTMILDLIGDKIISVGSLQALPKPRLKHNATLGISVIEEYWGQGVGEAMIRELIDWTENNGITKKISLHASAENIRGIKLYEKLGFVNEGLLINDMCINGKMGNTVVMGKLL